MCSNLLLLYVFHEKKFCLLCFDKICVFGLLHLTLKFQYVKLLDKLEVLVGSFNTISVFIFQGRVELRFQFAHAQVVIVSSQVVHILPLYKSSHHFHSDYGTLSLPSPSCSLSYRGSRFLKGNERGSSRFSYKNGVGDDPYRGIVYSRGCKHCFSSVMYGLCSNNFLLLSKSFIYVYFFF